MTKREVKTGWVDVKRGFTSWPEKRHIRHVKKQLKIGNQWELEYAYQPSAPYELEPSGYYPSIQLTFVRIPKEHRQRR